MNTTVPDLPVRFQKLFTSVAILSLLTYCGSIVSQYAYGLQMIPGAHSVWEIVSLVARIALPLVIFAVGVRMSRAGWWRRFMIGALCANGALLTQALFMMAVGLVGGALQLDYSILETLLSLATVAVWVVALWVFRAKDQLWCRRYAAYSLSIAGAAVVYTAITVIQVVGFAQGSSWFDWLAMIIAHLVVAILTLVAYFVLSGVSRSLRLFRVVLVVMTGFIAMFTLSDVVSIVAQYRPEGGADLYASSAYTVASIAVPAAVYVVALWWARPVAKKKSVRKLAAVKS